MTVTDKKIIELLASGLTQMETSGALKLLGHAPNSPSIIEKRLRTWKQKYGCDTIVQLFLRFRDMGLC